MLGYGWVFHIGFFNFYLSLGMCFWGMAFAWRFEPRRLAISAGLLIPAYVAHALPVLWAVGVIAWLAVARRLGNTRTLAIFVAALVALRVLISAAFQTRWSLGDQLTVATGLDQAWVFDGKYLVVGLLGLGMCALAVFRGLSVRTGKILALYALTVVGIAIIPSWVMIPGYQHALSYIAERMSLAGAVCLLAWLGTAPPRAINRWLTLAATAGFFSLLYLDEAKLNDLEDRMDAAAAATSYAARDFGDRIRGLAN